MKKAALVYASIHHGNTKKLVTEITKDVPITLYTVEQAKNADFSAYDGIGFASGVYMGKFHKSIFQFLKEYREGLPQKAFVVCTSGVGKGRYAKKFSSFLQDKGFTVLGGFECKGFDSFGPFKLIGGLGKGHPDNADIANGTAFIKALFDSAEKPEYPL